MASSVSIRDIFFQEATELLTELENSVLTLEENPEDTEALNAAFRAAHSLKSGSAMAEFPTPVIFLHKLEDLLGAVRDEGRAITPSLLNLLLQARDRLDQYYKLALADPGAEHASFEDLLAIVLELTSAKQTESDTAMGSSPAHAVPAEPEERPAAPATGATGAAANGSRRVHVRVQFAADAFERGVDVLSILDELSGIGRIEAITPDLSIIPPLNKLDPSVCALAFDIHIGTAASLDDVRSFFLFLGDEDRATVEEVDLDVPKPEAASPSRQRSAVSGQPSACFSGSEIIGLLPALY